MADRGGFAYPETVMTSWRTRLSALSCAVLLILAVAASSFHARADQTSPDLKVLFQQLKHAQDSQIAGAIEGEIWQIWRHTDDAEVNQHMQQGILQMHAGNLDAALKIYNRMVKAAPDFAEAWNKRATIYYYLGDYHASMADIQRTLALEPRHFGALSGMSLVLEKLGQYDDAIKALKKALEIDPLMDGGQAHLQHLIKLRDQHQI